MSKTEDFPKNMTTETPLAKHQMNYPHIAIIGAGIGGIALALACLERRIPFTLFERDKAFNARAQGYGLTLQQASKSMKKLGIENLQEGIVSTLHYAHTATGEVVGKWGLRSLENQEAIALRNKNKPTNIHIARQSLRMALMEQLGGENQILWSHQLIDYKAADKVQLTFHVQGEEKHYKADILVGADGIRSTVHNLLIGEEKRPLKYLDCIVILGICKLENLSHLNTHLLDGKTVFQTANGTERMYMMPFDEQSIMWQFSFPIAEEEAKRLSKEGAESLKAEVYKRAQWHSPVPEIILATPEANITGYPVYDRALLNPDLLKEAGAITLIGDAAHPMSPFKGQGANQAILDAILLAEKIVKTYHSESHNIDIRASILTDFEREMIERSSIKVKQSADAAKFLHTDIVLQEGNVTFGSKFSSSH